MSAKVLTMVFAAGALALAAAACSDGEARGTQEETVAIHYSRFSRDVITVRAGEPVTFVLENGDPIEHEWIVGTEASHEAHRTGTEPLHDTRPTEVTLPAYTTKRTTVTFDAPGEYAFICHLPGHEEYGMRGVVKVTK